MRKSSKILFGIILSFLILLPGTMQAAEEGWQPKADLLEIKDRMNLVSVNGKLYAIGGLSGKKYINAIDEYEVETDKWTTKTTFPTGGRSSSSSVVIDGKIYITGGVASSGAVTKSLDIYDPSTNVWTKGADLPVTLAGHSSQVVNNKIIVVGGFTRFNDAVTTTYEYDVSTNSWSKKADMLESRRYTSSALIDGKIYATGGYNDSKGVLSSVEEYDPVKNIWTKKTDMPKERYNTATISHNGLMYVIGGALATASLSGPATDAVDIYDPKTDKWSIGPSLDIPRHSIAVAELDGKLYIAGGSNSSTYYNNFEVLDVASEPPAELPVSENPNPPVETEEPQESTVPAGNRAILVVTMVNGLEKEYDLSMKEINSFTNWYDERDLGNGPARFVIDKHSNNKGPFTKRTDSIIFENILTFEINEYTSN